MNEGDADRPPRSLLHRELVSSGLHVSNNADVHMSTDVVDAQSPNLVSQPAKSSLPEHSEESAFHSNLSGTNSNPVDLTDTRISSGLDESSHNMSRHSYSGAVSSHSRVPVPHAHSYNAPYAPRLSPSPSPPSPLTLRLGNGRGRSFIPYHRHTEALLPSVPLANSPTLSFFEEDRRRMDSECDELWVVWDECWAQIPMESEELGGIGAMDEDGDAQLAPSFADIERVSRFMRSRGNGLPPDEFGSLRRFRAFPGEEEGCTECTICLATVCVPDGFPWEWKDCIQLRCSHIFHTDCIKGHLKLQSGCPNCRMSVHQ